MSWENKYTNEQLIKILKDLNKQNISKIDVDGNPNLPGAMTFIRRFGSWCKAVEAAQLQPGKVGRKKNDRKLHQ